MCCIFTCFGWMIDLFQRAWVFAMSCCISSAVCCSVITASMSGVALGYNYSLAEYIELKETNVSVYLKRGVFDDEVVDEMDWRRGGGGPAAAERRSMQQTSSEASSVPDFPYGYRRSNDEGIFATTQINEPNRLHGHDPDQHRFEGSLLKLTAKPGANVAGKDPGVADSELAKVMTAYPPNSMEQLKAIQGLMNRRMLENPLSNPSMITGSIPMEFLAMTTSLYPSAVPDEMRVIQKLLNDHKMAAKKFEHMKATKTPDPRPVLTGLEPQTTFSDLAGPMRRMGDAAQPSGKDDPMDPISNYFGARLPQMANDPSKWYQPKQTEPTSESNLFATRLKGPVTLSQSTTHSRIKAEELTLSQDSFRRAMLDTTRQKESKERDDNEKHVQNIINEPQKDYDEEDVKGFPVRRKRKKRNKRSHEENSIINQERQVELKQYGAGTGLFSKIMTALMTFNVVYGSENAMYNVLQEVKQKSSDSLLKSSGAMSTDVVTSSYVNIGASSPRDFLSKVVKSTIAY